MVSIVWRDGELSWRRRKRNAPEARTVLFSPSRVVFGKNNFAIGVADGSEADQGVMEGVNDLAGSGEVSE